MAQGDKENDAPPPKPVGGRKSPFGRFLTQPVLAMMLLAVVVAVPLAAEGVLSGSPEGSAPPARPSPEQPPDDSVGSAPPEQPPDDLTDSPEYRDCLREGSNTAGDCEVLLRDEVFGERARLLYRSCRGSGYDSRKCLAAIGE